MNMPRGQNRNFGYSGFDKIEFSAYNLQTWPGWRDPMHHQDIKTLQLFVTTCELRSVSKAAERLNLAPSAASRRIRLLEDGAKAPLLARRPHGVEPTAAGLTVLRYARDMLHLTERVSGLLDEHRSGVRGYIRISASSSVLVQRLASDLSRFIAEHPEIKLDLEEQPTRGTLEALITKHVDIGAIVTGIETGQLVTFPFGGDRLAVAVPRSHPFAGRRQLRFSEILGQDLVALDGTTAVRQLLVEQARKLGQFLKVRVQVSSFEVMGLMISKGLGIGILPEHAVRPFADALNLSLAELDEPWAERRFSLCVRSLKELDPPTRRLLAYLLDEEYAAPSNFSKSVPA
jgi:DNA-binding transcriptional LysR family regulator